jgi:ABC-2 type transport system ATP-binding protein
MVAGRHAASGTTADPPPDDRAAAPRHDPLERRRALAAAIIADRHAWINLGAVRGMPGDGVEAGLHIETSDFGRFVTALPTLAGRLGARLYEVSPADESLESVFAYLVAR